MSAASACSPGRGGGRLVDVEVAHTEVVDAVERRLAGAGVPSPRADARWLVQHVVELLGEPTGCGAAMLDGLVARRVAREPLQLVLGSTAFRTLSLACRPGVFIPRPETEVVAGVAIELARAATRPDGGVLVVEPCTGSGAIACSIVAEVAGATVVATDLDVAAVDLARENLRRLVGGEAGPPGPAPGAGATVLAGHLLDPVDPALRGQVDVLAANPPYLPASDRASWEAEVAEHEPLAALVAGPDGHEVVDALLVAAGEWLSPGGWVVLEIDERRGADALSAARRAGLTGARLVPDLAGADRAVVAQRPGSGG